MSLPPRIDRYETIRELGRGGMAVVYLARDPRVDREVAVKVLSAQFLDDARFRQRFATEARVVAGLEHPAIVPIYDFGEHDGQPYLVMRYMKAGSLRDRLDQGPLRPAEIRRILDRLAPALDRAHAAGVVHRDLKPDNILFDEDDQPYLSDFGLVRIVEASHTMSIVGTPSYMSPEQVYGDKELDGRSDLYNLGVVLYEMLTGHPPYPDETPTKRMLRHVLDPVPQLPASFGPRWQTLIGRCLAKEPDRRYATASELVGALPPEAGLIRAEPEADEAPAGSEGPAHDPVDTPVAVLPAEVRLPDDRPAGRHEPERRGPPSTPAPPVVADFPPAVGRPDAVRPDAVRPNPVRPNPVRPAADVTRPNRLLLLGVVLLALTVLLTGAAVLRAVRQPAPGNGDPAGAAATANTPAAAPSGALPATAATLAPVAGLDRPAASATLRPTPSLMPGPAGGPRVRVSRPSAALYQGPSPDFPVLRRLSEGQLLDVIAATADRTWLNVRLDDDLTGWIETAAVTAVALADLTAIEVAQTVPAPGTTAEVASPAATAPATATLLPGSTPLPPSATLAPATATAAATTTPPTETPRPSPTETPRPPTETPRPTNTPGLLPSLTPPLPTLPTP